MDVRGPPHTLQIFSECFVECLYGKDSRSNPRDKCNLRVCVFLDKKEH